MQYVVFHLDCGYLLNWELVLVPWCFHCEEATFISFSYCTWNPLQTHFQKYYDTVMPYLKAILVNANDKQNRMLRAKSMECISLVGMAVGKDKFREDAKQVHNFVALWAVGWIFVMYYRLIEVMSWCLNQCLQICDPCSVVPLCFMPLTCGIMLLFMFVGSAFWVSSQSHYNSPGMDVLHM